ncbi:MAG: AAA family ATPase, partial [Caldilineaceae bacterium]
MSILFGRARELALIEDAFQKTQSQQARTVLLAGESGSGKSALLEAVATACEERALVLRGSASDAEGMPPYLPFLEALGTAMRTLPVERLRQLCAPDAPILAGLFPELARRLDDTAAAFVVPPEQARLRLYQAVGQFIANLAAEHPLVFLLDDIHWAEAATFDLLIQIARTQRSAPVLWLLAYRSEEARRNPALERARAELNRLANAITIHLDTLSADALGQLATHYLAGSAQPTLVQELLAQSDGNPFYVEELLRHWRESGQIGQGAQGWQATNLRQDDLPEGIASLVGLRLARQPAPVIESLRAAAVVGRSFEASLVAALSGQPIESVEAHLQQALEAWLVQDGADGHFTFRHTQIRQTLYSQVLPSRRQRWHAALAQLLEQSTPQPLARLASHFARGGDPHKGAAYGLRAGHAAQQAYAWEEAITQYEAALGLLDPTDAQRGDALFHLGEALSLAGREREAVNAFAAARAWHKQAGDLLGSARAGHRLGQVYWRMEDLPNARAALESALYAMPVEPSHARVELLVDLGSLLAVSLHQMADGLALGQEALQLAQRLEDDRLLAAASRVVGNLLVRSNRLPAGTQQLEQALRLAVAADDPVEAAECCAHLTLAYAWSTDFQRARETLHLWEGLARQSHDLYQLRHIYSMAAAAGIVAGDWEQAEAHLNGAQLIVEGLTSPEPAALLRVNRGLLAYYRDDFAQAEAHFEAASETFRGLGPGGLVWYLGALGMALAAQGKR